MKNHLLLQKVGKLIVRGDSKLIFLEMFNSSRSTDFRENQQYKNNWIRWIRGILVINAVEDSKIKNVLFSDLVHKNIFRAYGSNKFL